MFLLAGAPTRHRHAIRQEIPSAFISQPMTSSTKMAHPLSSRPRLSRKGAALLTAGTLLLGGASSVSAVEHAGVPAAAVPRRAAHVAAAATHARAANYNPAALVRRRNARRNARRLKKVEDVVEAVEEAAEEVVDEVKEAAEEAEDYVLEALGEDEEEEYEEEEEEETVGGEEPTAQPTYDATDEGSGLGDEFEDEQFSEEEGTEPTLAPTFEQDEPEPEPELIAEAVEAVRSSEESEEPAAGEDTSTTKKKKKKDKNKDAAAATPAPTPEGTNELTDEMGNEPGEEPWEEAAAAKEEAEQLAKEQDAEQEEFEDEEQEQNEEGTGLDDVPDFGDTEPPTPQPTVKYVSVPEEEVEEWENEPSDTEIAQGIEEEESSPREYKGDKGGADGGYDDEEGGDDDAPTETAEYPPGDLEMAEEAIEVQAEEKDAKKVGGWAVVIAILGMIFTAWQVSENPDGVFASVCRLSITICGCILKVLLLPCKFLCGKGAGGGHHPISSAPDYREPYRGRGGMMEMA